MGFKKPFTKIKRDNQSDSKVEFTKRRDFFGKKPSVLPALKRRKKRIKARFR